MWFVFYRFYTDFQNLHMRHALNPQLQIGEILVGDIQFDIYFRDDIPQRLRGLQNLYNNTEVRGAILDLFAFVFIGVTDYETGCPGMALWLILVLGVLRPEKMLDLKHCAFLLLCNYR